MVIAVDFDRATVEHKYPTVEREIPFAFEILRKLQTEHHGLILWSVCESKLLDEAVTFYRERSSEFYTVSRDYPKEGKNLNNHFSRKLKAGIFIDDRNLDGLPDWDMVYETVNKRFSYEDLMRKHESEYGLEKPKGLFSRLFR